MATHVAHMREKRNACQVLMGKCEGNRLLGRPGNGWDLKLDVRVWTIFIWKGAITTSGCWKYNYESWILVT